MVISLFPSEKNEENAEFNIILMTIVSMVTFNRRAGEKNSSEISWSGFFFVSFFFWNEKNANLKEQSLRDTIFFQR